MIRKVLKESTLYTFANHITQISNLFILPIVTPYLTQLDYGIYGLIAAYTMGLSFLSDLGFVVLFQNTYFKDPKNYKVKWNKYLGFQWLWGVIYTPLVGLVFYFVFYDMLPLQEFIFILFFTLIPILLFNLTKSIGIKWCQYTMNHKIVYVSTMISSVLAIAVNFIGIYYFKMGYKAWLISNYLSSGILFLIYGYMLYIKNGFTPTILWGMSFLKESFKVALPVVPHGYSGYILNTSDRVLLNIFKVATERIGIYNIAYGFSNLVASANSALSMVLFPIYMQRYKKMEEGEIAVKSISDIFIYWFFFLLGICTLVGIWVRDIFYLLYRNPELNIAYQYSIFLLFSTLQKPLYEASVSYTIFKGETKVVLLLSLPAAILNIIFNIVFIPMYGIKAAILSTYLCSIYLALGGFAIKKVRRNIIGKHYPFWYFLAMVITPIVTHWIMNQNYLIKSISSASILVIIVLFIKAKKVNVTNLLR